MLRIAVGCDKLQLSKAPTNAAPATVPIAAIRLFSLHANSYEKIPPKE